MGKKCRFYVDIMAMHEEVTGSCNLAIVKFPNGKHYGLLQTVVCFKKGSMMN